MNIAETLRGLLRRWYIVIPGLLLAVAAAAYMWMSTPPSYQRSASQLLLPAEATLPEVEVKVEGGEEGETETLAPNPLLYLGGLNTAADVLVSAVRGAPSVAQLAERHEGAEIDIARDPMSSGPMLLIVVTAPDDEAAAGLVEAVLAETATVLDSLQTAQNVPDRSRVLISTIAADTESTLGTKDRMMMAAVAGGGIVLASVLLAAAVDGLVRRRRRRGSRKGKAGKRAAGEPARRRETVEVALDSEPIGTPNLVLLPTAADDVEAAIDRMLEREEASTATDADVALALDDEREAVPGGEPVGVRAVRRR